MNKINIDALIVVEGKEDVSYLSSFINSYFITTNGLDINKEKLDFIDMVSNNKKVIILTDPDDAGNLIRNKFNLENNNLFVVKITKNSRKNYKKQGVAESDKNIVINSLSNYITDKEIIRHHYNLSSIISLSDNPSKTRQNIINKYRLIYGNNNFLENQLNILGIKPEELLC